MTSFAARSTLPAVGLSVGSSTVAAVSAARAVTGRPVINRAGQPIEDFVDRVGDPVGIVAADGSLHSGADLLAEVLLALARRSTAGSPLPPTVAVAYPGYWSSAPVEALRRALRRQPPWSTRSARVDLRPDYTAALAGVGRDLPSRGVAVVCDFGARGTTITLVDLDGFGLVGTPLRHSEFSGDAIDRALLAHVLTAAGLTAGGTGTSAIAPLTRLRSECRAAKELLSAQTVTSIPGRVAGLRANIRITRPELDDLIRTPLTTVPTAVQDLLRRNGIAPNELAAVVSVGGGAAIPSVTTTLSRHLRVPVITARQPVLAAATGAAHLACPRDEESPTVVVPARSVPVALAWSQAADIPELKPLLDEPASAAALPVRAAVRPGLDFASVPAPRKSVTPRWYQQPVAVAAAVLMVIAGAGGGAALALRSDGDRPPAGTAQLPAGSVEDAAERNR
jgi:molecular chaperone DnaK (HSP70)